MDSVEVRAQRHYLWVAHLDSGEAIPEISPSGTEYYWRDVPQEKVRRLGFYAVGPEMDGVLAAKGIEVVPALVPALEVLIPPGAKPYLRRKQGQEVLLHNLEQLGTGKRFTCYHVGFERDGTRFVLECFDGVFVRAFIEPVEESRCMITEKVEGELA